MPEPDEVTPTHGNAFERVDLPRRRLQIDASGAVQLPSDVREAILAQGPGMLLAEVVDGELRVFSPKGAIRKVRRMIAEADWGSSSVVDQLLAERRAEALRDEAEAMLPASEW